MQKLNRHHALTFRVSDEEREIIRQNQELSGIRNMRAYLCKMAANGQIFHVELDGVREMNRLLSNATNNINQIARRVNQTDHVHTAELDEIKTRVDEIWTQQKEILKGICTIMEALDKYRKPIRK